MDIDEDRLIAVMDLWKKNGFAETGATNETEEYTVIVARREL